MFCVQIEVHSFFCFPQCLSQCLSQRLLQCLSFVAMFVAMFVTMFTAMFITMSSGTFFTSLSPCTQEFLCGAVVELLDGVCGGSLAR
jgi:hypothetical protein